MINTDRKKNVEKCECGCLNAEEKHVENENVEKVKGEDQNAEDRNPISERENTHQ